MAAAKVTLTEAGGEFISRNPFHLSLSLTTLNNFTLHATPYTPNNGIYQQLHEPGRSSVHPHLTSLHAVADPAPHSPPQDPTGKAQAIEHPASHGSSNNTDAEIKKTYLQRYFDPETTRQFKAQGNNGVGMEALSGKAIRQQERVAERSRLQVGPFFALRILYSRC